MVMLLGVLVEISGSEDGWTETRRREGHDMYDGAEIRVVHSKRFNA